ALGRGGPRVRLVASGRSDEGRDGLGAAGARDLQYEGIHLLSLRRGQTPRITRIRRMKTNKDRRGRTFEACLPPPVLILLHSSDSCYSWCVIEPVHLLKSPPSTGGRPS